MRAISIEETGPPSVLKVRELPTPEPGPGQALVRVHAAGVNFADVVMRRGDLPSSTPFVPGVEGAGVVEALGPGSADVAVGDRVAWAPVLGAGSVGSYAEFEVVDVRMLVPVPDDVTLEVAAAVILQGLTAHYHVYEKRPIGPGTIVLIHAAAGGMGLLLCQWMKREGATVIGTVSTPAKAELAKQAGADHTILYTQEDFAERTLALTGGAGADYIVDGVGRTTFRKDLEAAAIRGHICIYGMASGPPEPFSPLELLAKSLVVSGGMMTNFLRTRDEVLHKGAAVFRGVREGWLRAASLRSFPLEAAAQAHEQLEGRHSAGKLVLRVSE